MSVKPTLLELILNATAAGKSMLSAANAAAQKTLLSLVKGDVGLGNVDNTSDANKPVSTAQQTAIDGKIGGAVGSTTNRLPKSSGTDGLTLQASGITVDASNNVSGVGTIGSGVITPTVSAFTSYGGYISCVNANGFPDAQLSQGQIAGYGGSLKICDGTTSGGTGFVRMKYNVGFPQIETTASTLSFITSTGSFSLTTSACTITVSSFAYYTASSGAGVIANLFRSSAATQPVSVVRGFTSQSAALQEWQSSSSTFLVGINANGSIRIASGSGARAGNATLVVGTVTVTNTTVTANTVIYLTTKTAGGTIGTLTYTLSAGASFTINSSSASDTSVISYLLIEVN